MRGPSPESVTLITGLGRRLKPNGPECERTALVGAESGLSDLWGASVATFSSRGGCGEPLSAERRETTVPFPLAPGAMCGRGRFRIS